MKVATSDESVYREVPVNKIYCKHYLQDFTSVDTDLSKNGINSGDPGLFLQSLIKSAAIANREHTCTPAARIRSFASSAILLEVVPEASALANTV